MCSFLSEIRPLFFFCYPQIITVTFCAVRFSIFPNQCPPPKNIKTSFFQRLLFGIPKSPLKGKERNKDKHIDYDHVLHFHISSSLRTFMAIATIYRALSTSDVLFNLIDLWILSIGTSNLIAALNSVFFESFLAIDFALKSHNFGLLMIVEQLLWPIILEIMPMVMIDAQSTPMPLLFICILYSIWVLGFASETLMKYKKSNSYCKEIKTQRHVEGFFQWINLYRPQLVGKLRRSIIWTLPFIPFSQIFRLADAIFLMWFTMDNLDELKTIFMKKVNVEKVGGQRKKVIDSD